ncbi:MbtH family protein [Umezawaea sp. NPDC059074]|uniref:MbtH family protein n=1 Tax=Umezawaea sp. NPDC059074 TaxID=3346716 RepID=UPI0036B1D518
MDDNSVNQVLVNEEGQYSLWPMDKEVPAGWASTGKSGSRQFCMDYVDQVWTDMRPRKLREQMATD